MNAPMEAKTSPKVKTWVWRVVEAAGDFRPANEEWDSRWAQGAGLAKSRPRALGKCLFLIVALADPAADKHGGTEKGGMCQNGGMARRLVPFAIFSSSLLSSAIRS